jgi:multiple sugar transport system ATP-binding protein
MSEGTLQQIAPPESLYNRPANTFVAAFLGSPGMNLIEGMLVESGPPASATGAEGDGGRGTLCVAFPGASVPLPAEVAEVVRGAGPDIVLGLRPEAVQLSSDGSIGASVVIVELLGAETHVICTTETGTRLIVRQDAAAPKPAIGESVRIAVAADPRAYHLFDAATGERLGPT